MTETASAASSSPVQTMPPSPVVMFFVGWKLKTQILRSPAGVRPTGPPLHEAPSAWAASSMTARLCLRAMSRISSIRQGRPAKCTGTIAFVCGVIAASIASGRMFSVRRSISARTGRAPVNRIVLTVAAKVIGVVTTSSPWPIPSAMSARCNPAVAELTASAYGASTTRANSFSNASVLGPVVIHPERIDSAMSCIASSPMDGRAKGRKSFLMGRSPPWVCSL